MISKKTKWLPSGSIEAGGYVLSLVGRARRRISHWAVNSRVSDKNSTELPMALTSGVMPRRIDENT